MKKMLSAAVLAAMWCTAVQAHKEHATPPAPTATVPAGTYQVEPTHAFVVFKLNHLGFSNYMARFKRFDASLQFDPNNIAASKLTATIDVKSLETDFPDVAKLDFNAELTGKQWLDAAQYPTITFQSKRIELTGAKTLRVHGDLTLHGVTKPLTLQATYNGGYAGHPMDPHARIGFSAQGVLKRSEFGVSYGIPAPGTTMGVGDEVTVMIEFEFSGPPLASAK